MASDIEIEIKGVWKIFGSRAREALADIRENGTSKQRVLKEYDCVVGVADVDLAIRRGEIFCVMGLSGSGKSTLVRHINRLLEPTAGEIRVNDRDILALSQRELRRYRNEHIAMVFQNFALLPHRSVLDNIAMPLEIRGVAKNRRMEIAERILAMVELAGWGNKYAHELSGGMQQRVGLARAIAVDSQILLMDEPFSALDPLIRRQLQDEFMQIASMMTKTTVFITHDLDEAIRIGSRIAIMNDGRIVQVGTPEEIVTNPIDDYVRDFVEGISTLKLVFAHTIMERIGEYRPRTGEDLSRAPRAAHDVDLSELIDLSTTTEQPIVITHGGTDVGVVDKATLLKGIKGGKD